MNSKPCTQQLTKKVFSTTTRLNPSDEQQSRYAFQGGVAILLVTALVLFAFGVS